jgi:hypothetical protein
MGSSRSNEKCALRPHSHIAAQRKVLIAGGYGRNGNPTNSAELYDPLAGTWALTGPLKDPRVAHRATLLRDGRVLVEGGYNGSATLSSAELYDPAAGTWSTVGSYEHSAPGS